MTAEVANRYSAVRSDLDAIARRSGRDPASVTLIAVSKQHPVESMQQLIDGSSTTIEFGENYVQEYRDKRPRLRGEFRCHLIGRLQRNKAKEAVRLFDCIQTVESQSLADALQKAAASERKRQEVYVQVNVSGDPEKGGVAPEEVVALMHHIREHCPALRATGLMTITKFYEDAELVRPDFSAMKAIHAAVKTELGINELALSMGMSADYAIAVECGASVVRVGTAIFGERNSK